MTRKRFVVPFLFLFALVWLPGQTQAQDLSQFWIFTVEPQDIPTFEAAFKAHVEFRQAQGDPWTWYTHQVAVGEELGTYYVASWNHTWADFDAYDAWEGGEAASSHFMATVGPLLKDMSTEITQSNREMERMPADPMSVNLVNVTTFHVIPGKQMQFFENMMKFHEAIVEADLPFYYASDYLVAGGKGPVFSLAGFGERWADFADPDPDMEEVMTEKYGQEEAMEIFAAFAGSYSHYESFIVRARPDLSGPGGM